MVCRRVRLCTRAYDTSTSALQSAVTKILHNRDFKRLKKHGSKTSLQLQCHFPGHSDLHPGQSQEPDVQPNVRVPVVGVGARMDARACIHGLHSSDSSLSDCQRAWRQLFRGKERIAHWIVTLPSVQESQMKNCQFLVRKKYLIERFMGSFFGFSSGHNV